MSMSAIASTSIVDQLKSLNELYPPLVDALLDAGQEDIFSKFDISETTKISKFFDQVRLLENGYPGGIVAYVKQSRKTAGIKARR